MQFLTLARYNGPMIILIGASATGKTEIAKLLGTNYGIKKAITHTSRPIRPGEKDGVDYHFVSEEEFNRLYEEGKMVERTSYHGHSYGCSKSEVKNDRCVILDPSGFHRFQALNDPGIVSFLLTASEETRRSRMLSRGDDPASVEERIRLDREAFSLEKIGKTDYVIDTEGKTLLQIASEIHIKYLKALQAVKRR